MHYFQKYLLSTLLFFTLTSLSGQSPIFLQLERFNNPKSIKFYEGETLEFRLKEYPDTWKKHEIIDFKADEQLVVFEEQYYSIEEFKDLRIRHNVVKSLGNRFMQASAVWFVYGGIATLAVDNYTIGKRDVILGGSVALIGLLMNKVFDKRRVRLSKKKRLRVMDLRFNIGRG
jgi:hypothetical protein